MLISANTAAAVGHDYPNSCCGRVANTHPLLCTWGTKMDLPPPPPGALPCTPTVASPNVSSGGGNTMPSSTTAVPSTGGLPPPTAATAAAAAAAAASLRDLYAAAAGSGSGSAAAAAGSATGAGHPLASLVSQQRLLELSRFGLRHYDLAQHMLSQQGAVTKLLGCVDESATVVSSDGGCMRFVTTTLCCGMMLTVSVYQGLGEDTGDELLVPPAPK